LFRFALTKATVDDYAASVRNEIIDETALEPLEHEDNNHGDYDQELERLKSNAAACEHACGEEDQACRPHWLLQDRAVIGSQFYWHCSPEELAKVISIVII
jgi:hypothetical protein